VSSVDCRANFTRSLVVIENSYGHCTKSYLSIHFIIVSITVFEKSSFGFIVMHTTEVIVTIYLEVYIKSAFEF
jgi:hypothetical protein